MREFQANPMQAAAFIPSRTSSSPRPVITQLSISFGEKTITDFLKAGWQSVVDRHGILRSTFSSTGQSVIGQEHTSSPLHWKELDWQGEAPDKISDRWSELLALDASQPIDPSCLPLVRFHEIRLPGGSSHFLMSFPSFLLDEQSIVKVIADWLVALGQPLAATMPTAESPTPGSLSEWKELLAGAEGHLTLHPRPDRTGCGSAQNSLGREETAAFKSFCKEKSLSAEMVIHSLWSLVLRRFGATGNISLALHNARQGQEVGYFENWLPVLHSWEGSVANWLETAQKRHSTSQSNSWINPSSTLPAIGDANDPHDAPLAFSWRGESLSDIIHTALPRWINFDGRIQEPPPIAHSLHARDGIRISLQLCAHSESAARDILGRLINLISELPAIFDKPLSKVPVLLPEEIATLRSWTRGPESIDHPDSIVTAFRQMVEAHPETIAVQDGEYALTFSLLDSLSDKLASHMAKAGFSGGWHVGLFLSNTSWVAVALIGAWKAGNLCVPIDSSAPKEWVESSLLSNDVGVVLCDALSAPLMDESTRRRIVLDQEWDTLESSDLPPAPTIQPETPAAILAGFHDGEPPTVRALTHGQLLAASLEGARVLNFGPDDKFLAHSHPGAGAFFDEWLLPLLSGGTVVIAQNHLLDAATAPVTHLRLTAPEWHNQAIRWGREDGLASATLKLVAVEAGSPRSAALAVWNQHAAAPLHTVIFFSPAGLCGLGIASSAKPDGLNLSFGRPTPDVEVSVYDPNLHEIPPGFTGDLVFRFPGWKKTGGGGGGRRGISTGLRAWRNRSGDITVESATHRAPGISDEVESRKENHLLAESLDAHVGAQSWVLSDAKFPGVFSVPEWPLTRAGWIDDSQLPLPELPAKSATPVRQTGEVDAPSSGPAAPSIPWQPLTILQAKGDAPTLVLIHSASGTPDVYNDLATAVGPTRRIIGILARGFHNPEACHPSVESAAAAYIDALLEEDPSASFLLSGFGLGGTIALEMARQLTAAGRQAPDLLLIGSTPPEFDSGGGWMGSIKQVLKKFSTPDRMEPHHLIGEPSISHEKAWKNYRFEYGEMPARIILPSDFPSDGAAKWLTILPNARIIPVKCRWDEMLVFPAVKRLAHILSNEE